MVRLRIIVAAATGAVLLALAAPTAWAGFDEGVAAFERGDYAVALREFRALADEGYAGAQFNVGIIYHYGHGVGANYARAMKWYRRAAAQGFDDAQFNLGFMYEYGRGVAGEDYAAAVKWYRKAAEQGSAKAQNSLGFMHDNGRGVPRSYMNAHMWYDLAAAQGDEQAAKIRDRVAAKMTASQISGAQRRADEWRAKLKQYSRQPRHISGRPTS